MNWLAGKFELTRGGDAANVRPMEGLRGYAVFLVFLVHYVTLVEPWISSETRTMEIADGLRAIGNSGVDLFFVLSGYLIYGSLIRRRQAYSRFIYRRIERIYPTFVVVFLFYICLSFLFRRESKIPVEFADAALYLAQNFLLLPGLFPIEPMITVAWSLSYEMFYYLIIPVAIEGLRLRERRPFWRISFFVFVVVLAAVYCAAYGGHIRLIMFIAGILLHEAIACTEKLSGYFDFVGAAAMVVGIMGGLFPIDGSASYTTKIGILFIAFFFLCLTCFLRPSGWLARMFCWTPMRWLGNMSYSYYLIHGVALKVAFSMLAVLVPVAVYGPWLFWLLLPLMFLVTLVPSGVLFVAIERTYSLSAVSGRGESKDARVGA
ncbi:Acyltransferase [Rubrivivax sp. A210]|uniref:acyltransferase family protein n=1 Tax=Rubrivivax sp. A210 TaxID=2772301 RepID=UPI0019185C9F|nr:acyltransferase [Rubrivivax sp. A210]CAD5375223.1 Acyltransferase [Rubrivivax sp. A210]